MLDSIKTESIALLREKIQNDISKEEKHNTGKSDPSLNTVIYYLGKGDSGLIALLVLLVSSLYLYDHSTETWYRFKKHCWKEDPSESIYKVGPEILRKLLKQKLNEVNKPKTDDQNNSPVTALEVALKSLKSVAYCNRIIDNSKTGDRYSESEIERGLGITGEEWDVNKHLLPFKNGVLDTRTGEFRDGKPTDYLKNFIPHEWKGLNEPAPNFMHFLKTSLPQNAEDPESDGDMEVIKCLQRCIGHSFGSSLKEHMLVVLAGKNGRNGKTTLMEILRFCFGDDYVYPAQSSLLTKQTFTRSSAGPSPDLMALRGKRIVFASEAEKGAKMDCEQVKHLTGGDSITARPCYGHNVTFPPTHQLFLITNDIPSIAYDDLAMWYRLRIFEFPLSFVDTPTKPFERIADKDLMNKLKQEASGIIAWVIRGYMDYLRQGIKPPESVIASVREFQLENNTLCLFISEALVSDPKGSIPAKTLYMTYLKWTKDVGITNKLNQRKFGEEIVEHIKRVEEASGRVYKGYKVIDTK